MKNFEVKYEGGHLVDIKTGKRILLKRGGNFSILGDDDQFEEHEQISLQRKIMDSKEKETFLIKKYSNHILHKILDSGTVLYYRIGIPSGAKKELNRFYYFNAILHENLYLKSKDGKSLTLCDCMCKTTQCIECNIQMFEHVEGYSLNNLFSNMVAFYFPLIRSGACNAFDTFYTRDKQPNKQVASIKYLREYRDEINSNL
ncbi:MAG: hypothetical protein SCALA702_06290 [Melioribacteraceae bacterium]|nr:MAG: hypothetical protein SCALA702_06290 [Melioribacteraceae bacterium]